MQRKIKHLKFLFSTKFNSERVFLPFYQTVMNDSVSLFRDFWTDYGFLKTVKNDQTKYKEFNYLNGKKKIINHFLSK